MGTSLRVFPAAAAAVALLCSLAACSVDVTKNADGRRSAVDIRTPVGDMSASADVDAARDIGLPAYPGATPVRDHGREGGNVDIETGWFGVKVAVAKFESEDAPRRVLDFYKNEMTAYGAVIECSGEVDYRSNRRFDKPYCKERRSRSGEIQLATGTEQRQRRVIVKPRGNGSRFDLVYVDTRDEH